MSLALRDSRRAALSSAVEGMEMNTIICVCEIKEIAQVRVHESVLERKI